MTTTDLPARTIDAKRGSLVILCAAMFLVLLDVSIVNVALPSIADGLGGGTAGAQAVVDSYTVPLAALLLTAGAAADRWGARRGFVAGLLGFGAGSVACAAAPNLLVLVAGRLVQGIGAAAMLPASLALITAIWVDPVDRARAIAVWSGVSGSAVAVGPLIGGALIGVGGWRLIFLVNLPVVVAATAGARTLPIGQVRDRRIDWCGAVASTVCLGCLIGVVIDIGRAGLAGASAIPAVGCLVGAGVFVVGQRRSRTPMVPRELWRNWALIRSCGGSFGMNLVGNGSLLVVAFLLQIVQGRDAFQAGVATVPMLAPLAAVPLLGRRRMVRIRPDRLIRTGFALGAVGELALAASVWRAPHSVVALLPGMLLAGSALGVLVTPLVATAMAAAPAHSGLIGGLNNAARQSGTSVGVALFGAVAGAATAPSATTRIAACFVLGAAGWAVCGVLTGRADGV